MTETVPVAARLRRKSALWLAIGAGLLVVIGANVHLVYVATVSQPECVDHVRVDHARAGHTSALLSAARSSCTSR